MAPPTSIDPRSDAYLRTREAMQGLLDELRARHEQVLGDSGGHHELPLRAGDRLAPRERIDLLLDRDSPFLELATLAGWDGPDPVGGGLVLGIGIVEGVECIVLADDHVEPPGRWSPTAVAKARRGHELARRNGLPIIHLLDGRRGDVGTALPDPAELEELADLRSIGVPTIAVVFDGPGAHELPCAALSEHTIVTAPGPARRADERAVDEVDGVRLARQVVRNLNWPSPPRRQGPVPAPLLDGEELLGILPADESDHVDVREVIWRIVDGSEVDEFKPFVGPGLVTGWAAVCGFPVGIVATNGPLLTDESDKGAEFIERCSARSIPVVFVQNHATARTGASLVQACARSTVPHVTVLIGPEDGADTMATGTFAPRFVFSWPNHRVTPEVTDDAVIDPRDTRVVLGIALSSIHAHR